MEVSLEIPDSCPLLGMEGWPRHPKLLEGRVTGWSVQNLDLSPSALSKVASQHSHLDAACHPTRLMPEEGKLRYPNYFKLRYIVHSTDDSYEIDCTTPYECS